MATANEEEISSTNGASDWDELMGKDLMMKVRYDMYDMYDMCEMRMDLL